MGDNFSEFGDGNVDARGDTGRFDPQFGGCGPERVLGGLRYILNANKYMMAPRGRMAWDQNRQRAFERAAVWMRHYRNHPSVVMWIAGFNFFNNAMDADPRHIGVGGWDQNDARWQRLMAAGQDMFDGLKQLDSTRAYYSHAGRLHRRSLHYELLSRFNSSPGTGGVAECLGGTVVRCRFRWSSSALRWTARSGAGAMGLRAILRANRC